jgi:hypothetical protein
MVEFAAVMKVMAAKPVGINMARNVQYDGMSPQRTSSAPKTIAEPTTSLILGLPRRAAARAPASVPVARALESRPKESAPRSKTCLANSAMVSWKLSPKVPMKKTVTTVSMSGGRRAMYRRAAAS